MSLYETRMADTVVRGESDMNVKAKLGVTEPQAKEHVEPPEAGRKAGGFSLRAVRGSAALRAPRFKLPASRNRRENFFIILSHLAGGTLLWLV